MVECVAKHLGPAESLQHNGGGA